MEQDIQEIKRKLSTCDHQIRLSEQYIIRNRLIGKTAIRFWKDGQDGYLYPPFSPENIGKRILKVDLLRAKSISCESGFYVCPLEDYYENLTLNIYMRDFRSSLLFALIEYEEDDVIYKKYSPPFISEACLLQGNIVFAGNYSDYEEKSKDALKVFAKYKPFRHQKRA